MSEISFEAFDSKKGMSLAELKNAVDKAAGLAEINETDTDKSKVFILINWSGGIKKITMEV